MARPACPWSSRLVADRHYRHLSSFFSFSAPVVDFVFLPVLRGPWRCLGSVLFICSVFTLFLRWPCVWGRRNAGAREPRQIGGGGRQTRQNPRKEEEERVSRGVDVPVMRGLTAVGRCPGQPPMHHRRRLPLPRCRTDRCRRKRPRPLGALSSRRAADRRARA